MLLRSAVLVIHVQSSPYQLFLCAGYLGSLVVNCSYAEGMPATEALWHQLPWGPCSLQCGAGVQQRTVECRASNGSVLDAVHCPGEVPATSQACNTQPCTLVLWKVRGTRGSQPIGSAVTVRAGPSISNTCCMCLQVGECGKCNATCGSGTMSRAVVCSTANSTAAESLCSLLPR